MRWAIDCHVRAVDPTTLSELRKLEETWSYRLNGLVDAACNAHGLVPVVLVLNQLLGQCRDSFVYVPPMALIGVRDGEETRVGELDIVCLMDGELIVGEVKETTEGFQTSDFDDMIRYAEMIRPDRVLFSALSPASSSFVSTQVERVAGALEPLGVRAEWYELHDWIFDAHPVR
jgi:hypothetical protein